MKLGILTDIHANREAYEACLARLQREDIDQIVILGDIVGYGADPDFCVETTQKLSEAGAIVVRGNHDQAILDLSESMSSNARAAIEWTRTQVSSVQAQYLGGLPLTVRIGDVLITHANGWAPEDFGYLQTTRDAERNLRATDAHLTLCGHTHVPVLFYALPMRAVQAFVPTHEVPVPLSARLRWIAVVGSVGQPRNGSPQANCATYDMERRNLTYFKVAYDVETAARKVRAAGLPDVLAERLLKGR